MLNIIMATRVKSEVVWLPSHEEIIVKQEKDDPVESWTYTPGSSNPEMIECKAEITHEIIIKEEPQEINEDKELSLLDSEHVNHLQLQADKTPSVRDDCGEVNCVDSDKHTGSLVEAPYCETIFFKENKYKKHMDCGDKKHDSLDVFSKESYSSSIGHGETQIDEKRFMCDICNKGFTTKQILIRHVRIHTGEKPFSCNICDKQFTEYSHLTSHKRTHTGEKPFPCDLCPKRFTQQGALARHRLIHTGFSKKNIYKDELSKESSSIPVGHGVKEIRGKSLVCDVCNRKFSRKQKLIVHARTHTGEKPFSCDLCQKQFSVIGTLVRHKKTHTGETPFSCDLCHKQFTEKGTLTKHRRIHTGDKLLSCDFCHKQFAVSSALIRHSRTHTGEKPFSCDMCPKQFIENNALIRHRRRHTGEKPFPCDQCDKHFASKVAVTRHRTIHNFLE